MSDEGGLIDKRKVGIAKDRRHFGVITRYGIVVRWVRLLIINWGLVFRCIGMFLWAETQDKRGGDVKVCILYSRDYDESTS